MAFRILISLAVIICAYLAFETVRFKILHHKLLNTEAEYVLGNPEGDLTFVKFFEYSCTECRAGFPIIQKALEQDGNVKFIVRPLRMMNVEGVSPDLMPYAAAKQGKFKEMHEVLVKNYRVINDQVIQDLSLEIGIDHQQLKADLKDDDVLKARKTNEDIARGYNLKGTPVYAIGKDILFIPNKQLSASEFIDLFNEARGQ